MPDGPQQWLQVAVPVPWQWAAGVCAQGVDSADAHGDHGGRARGSDCPSGCSGGSFSEGSTLTRFKHKLTARCKRLTVSVKLSSNHFFWGPHADAADAEQQQQSAEQQPSLSWLNSQPGTAWHTAFCILYQRCRRGTWRIIVFRGAAYVHGGAG